jgi:hypothetical protein
VHVLISLGCALWVRVLQGCCLSTPSIHYRLHYHPNSGSFRLCACTSLPRSPLATEKLTWSAHTGSFMPMCVHSQYSPQITGWVAHYGKGAPRRVFVYPKHQNSPGPHIREVLCQCAFILNIHPRPQAGLRTMVRVLQGGCLSTPSIDYLHSLPTQLALSHRF